MDGHPPQQSSDDTPSPDDRLDEDAPAATDASMSRGAGGRSAESTGSSGGGESIRDSAHDRPRGDEIRTGESYFRRRGSRARGDEDDGPPPRRRRVEWVVYTGQVVGGKLNGTGKKTLACGRVDEGVFVDGRLNGRGKRTFAQGAVFEGNFVGGSLREGKVTLTDEEGVFVDGSLREGKKTFADGEVQEGVYGINEEGYHRLHGRGKVTSKNGIMQEGVFVDGHLHEGKGMKASLSTNAYMAKA
ncbi:hypothetical protein THAOC_14387, partial [Thalassiosira oceanica]